MLIIREPHLVQNSLRAAGIETSDLGFVPTMGALHSGHISLITKAKTANRHTICSIFVNPIQFNNPSDFEKYPITLDNDIKLLEEAGCDVLLLPTVEGMYPEGIAAAKEKIYDLNGLDTHLEGNARPGHFQGVALVVHRLLQMVQPSHLYMGIKDYQQCMVVRTLIEKEKIPTQLVICPTEREPNGLAKSSRNQRLSEKAKEQAKAIYQCLQYFKQQQHSSSFAKDCLFAKDLLEQAGLTLEYFTLANALTLAELKEYDSAQPMVVLVAAYLEEVRLIDNLVITES